MIIVVISTYFWGHVDKSTDICVASSGLSCEPEIYNFYLVLAIYKNVFRRNVSMNKPIVMDLFKSF